MASSVTYKLPSLNESGVVTAEYALNNGADIINDISGMTDDNMVFLCGQSKCAVCIMHMQFKIPIHNGFDTSITPLLYVIFLNSLLFKKRLNSFPNSFKPKTCNKLTPDYDRIKHELARIGVDSYALNMVKKGVSLNILVRDIKAPAANILKQESIASGISSSINSAVFSL